MSSKGSTTIYTSALSPAPHPAKIFVFPADGRIEAAYPARAYKTVALTPECILTPSVRGIITAGTSTSRKPRQHLHDDVGIGILVVKMIVAGVKVTTRRLSPCSPVVGSAIFRLVPRRSGCGTVTRQVSSPGRQERSASLHKSRSQHDIRLLPCSSAVLISHKSLVYCTHHADRPHPSGSHTHILCGSRTCIPVAGHFHSQRLNTWVTIWYFRPLRSSFVASEDIVHDQHICDGGDVRLFQLIQQLLYIFSSLYAGIIMSSSFVSSISSPPYPSVIRAQQPFQLALSHKILFAASSP